MIDMRMWMVNPKILCKNHLLGEHFEIHKAVSNLRQSGTWTKSLTKHGYLNPQSFKERHDILVKEMKNRGYKHNSILNVSDITLEHGDINVIKSLHDLIERCNDCFKQYKELVTLI
jgi:hypothetical protein